MHELSIANSLVELVGEQIAADELASVRSIKLCIGALTCVHPDALRFCFDLLTKDTPLQYAQLDIAIVPVSIYCSNCDAIQQIAGIQSFHCPVCQTPSADIRSGQELDLEMLQLEGTCNQNSA